ncbi:MAG: adenylate/guanylate cyclase domain-containing protein, partial [Leptospiraceae bacterium]|nr:adenylate/guanylate cyclase domain-containing protein [Leptospiraceae bacterium]
LTLLNTYFNDMIEIIFRYKGTLDKIIGDGIMAIYGAPINTENPAKDAVQTAVDMQRKLKDFNIMRELMGKSPIQIGIGVHTGEVILGRVGTSKRLEFTAIGDTVNTASRLESFTKEARRGIIISEETRKYLNGEFTIDMVDSVSLKGKHNKVQAYSVSYE